MLVVNNQISIPREEFEFTFARSSGPGGQNVNKVNSKAVLRWPIVVSPSLPDAVRTRFITLYRKYVTTEGDLVITSQKYRDQPKNIDDCLEKLREMIVAAAHVPKKRRPTKPTYGSTLRRKDEKKKKSTRKQERGKSWGDE